MTWISRAVVDQSTSEAIPLEAIIASACKSSSRVGTIRIGIARAGNGITFVRIRTSDLGVTTESSIARAYEISVRIGAQGVGTTSVGVRTFIDIEAYTVHISETVSASTLEGTKFVDAKSTSTQAWIWVRRAFIDIVADKLSIASKALFAGTDRHTTALITVSAWMTERVRTQGCGSWSDWSRSLHWRWSDWHESRWRGWGHGRSDGRRSDRQDFDRLRSDGDWSDGWWGRSDGSWSGSGSQETIAVGGGCPREDQEIHQKATSVRLVNRGRRRPFSKVNDRFSRSDQEDTRELVQRDRSSDVTEGVLTDITAKGVVSGGCQRSF